MFTMNNNQIVRISEENQAICTMQVASTEDKKAFYNATQNPTAKVSDFINQTITIRDVYMEKAQYVDEETGLVTDGVKTIIITPEGEGILANSMGVARSLYSLFDIFGMPSEWDEPITVKVKQIEVKGGNRYFKFEVQ